MRAPSPLAAAKSPSYHLAAFHSSRLEALPQAAAQAAMPRLDGPLLGLLALQEQVPANWAQLVEARLREDWGVQHWCRWSVPAWHNGQDWVREGFGGLALVARLPHTELHSHPIGGYDETALASLGQQQEAGRLGVLQMASNTPFLTPRISKLQAASEAFLLVRSTRPSRRPLHSWLKSPRARDDAGSPALLCRWGIGTGLPQRLARWCRALTSDRRWMS